MKKILIIEDEVKLRNELKVFLNNNGLDCIILEKFNDVYNSILNTNCDLVLLDINLPDVSGEYILKSIRDRINIPIIIVTSRNTEIDELLSINYGADDFITKPYNSQILLARINRLLNRNTSDNIVNYNDIVLNVSKSLLIKNNDSIELSKNELKIFYYLLINRGKIVSRDDLMNYLWDTSEFIDDNTLTVNINRLRNKLEDIGYYDVILTRRGQGYIVL